MIIQTDEKFFNIPDDSLLSLSEHYLDQPNSVRLIDYGKEVDLLYIGGCSNLRKGELIKEAYQKKFGKEDSYYRRPARYYKGQLLWYHSSSGVYLPCEIIKITPEYGVIEIRLIDRTRDINMKAVRSYLYEKHIELE